MYVSNIGKKTRKILQHCRHLQNVLSLLLDLLSDEYHINNYLPSIPPIDEFIRNSIFHELNDKISSPKMPFTRHLKLVLRTSRSQCSQPDWQSEFPEVDPAV